MIPKDVVWAPWMDQAAAALRDTAAVLSDFRQNLIDGGFSEEGAERMADTLLIGLLPNE